METGVLEPAASPEQNALRTPLPQGNNRCAGRILIAEEDVMLLRFLQRLFEAEGYQVETAASAVAALTALRAEPDLLLLDLNQPEADSCQLLQQLRPRFPRLPVMVLTGRGRVDGLVPALDGGADDCLLKPFSYRELLARVRALLRRSLPPVPTTSWCADLVLSRDHMLVKRGDRRIELTQREFALLENLMRTPEIPVSRSVLLKEIWGETCEPSTNVVDVYMKYVRDKVDLPGLPRLVRTVRGTGYMVSAA